MNLRTEDGRRKTGGHSVIDRDNQSVIASKLKRMRDPAYKILYLYMNSSRPNIKGSRILLNRPRRGTFGLSPSASLGIDSAKTSREEFIPALRRWRENIHGVPVLRTEIAALRLQPPASAQGRPYLPCGRLLARTRMDDPTHYRSNAQTR